MPKFPKYSLTEWNIWAIQQEKIIQVPHISSAICYLLLTNECLHVEDDKNCHASTASTAAAAADDDYYDDDDEIDYYLKDTCHSHRMMNGDVDDDDDFGSSLKKGN